jgi:hypothetical protein
MADNTPNSFSFSLSPLDMTEPVQIGFPPPPEMACPIHGSVTETISFTLDGETETFCLRCIRDLFRRGLLPRIDNESTRISVAPSVPGTRRSRYDLLKKGHRSTTHGPFVEDREL